MSIRLLPIFLASVGFAQLGFAQQSATNSDPFAGVEEMLVIGSGTENLLAPQNTAAIAFDSSTLKNIGVDDIGDLADYVPNLEVNTTNATNASFFIRGVGLQDFGANASSSVPIFQDGIPRDPSATQLVGLFDISGVSVQKGPQGSGNFRNASAGTFIVKTNVPQPEFSGMARVSLSRLTSVDARDANRYNFEAATSAPVYKDVVSMRIATRFSHENAFWENRCANRSPLETRPVRAFGRPPPAICGETFPSGLRSDVNPFLRRYVGEVDDYAIRGSLRVKPEDAPIDWITRVEYSSLNRDTTAGQSIGTGAGVLGQSDFSGYRDPDLAARQAQLFQEIRRDNPTLSAARADVLSQFQLAKELAKDPLSRHPYRGAMDHPGRTILDTRTISTTAIVDLDVTETTLNFGYIDYRKSEVRDQDITPNDKFGAQGNDQAWEMYGDVSTKGESIGSIPISWNTGIYTLFEKIEAFNRQNLGRFDAGGLRQRNKFQQEIRSFGVFLEGAYDLTELISLSMGGRYNWEQKDFEVSSVGQSQFSNVPFESSNQRTWDAFTGFVNLSYQFTEDISTYIKYTRGFKAGHFNPSDARAAKVPGQGFADPESIDSVEWGIAGSLFAGRLRTNGAFFYYNYTNYQVFRLTTNFQGVSRVVQNAKRARNFGAEIEFVLTPLEGFVPEFWEGLNVTFRGGWLEAQFVQFTVLEQRLFAQGTFGVPIDYSGNPLLNAPNLQASAIVVWPFATDSFGTITPQYDFTWSDDIPFDPNRGRGEPNTDGTSNFTPYTLGNRAYMLHNLRLTWAPPGDAGFQVSGWCRNVTDKRYKVFAVDLTTFSAQQLAYVADPRLCGADIRFTW